MNGCGPGNIDIWLLVIREGIPQVVATAVVPFHRRPVVVSLGLEVVGTHRRAMIGYAHAIPWLENHGWI